MNSVMFRFVATFVLFLALSVSAFAVDDKAAIAECVKMGGGRSKNRCQR